MNIPLLPDMVIILGLSVVIIFLFKKLRLPTILGFLITGIIAGPGGLSLVTGVHEVEVLAEIGVILLLFIIGMEFSLKTLASMQRIIFIGGFTQVGLTIGATFLAAYYWGYSWNEAVFLGFLLSLSSTAIVLSVLQEKGAMTSPQGKISLAVLIFQDIIVVPMMLFTPLMTGDVENVWGAVAALLLKAVLVVALVILSAQYVIPLLLREIARTQSRELFLLSIIVICFAVAWGTSSIGLSLALGAFMAGLVISESEYSYHATGLILPFREIFTSFFFVSIGMLLDFKFFITHLGLILLLTIGVVFVKGLIAAGAALLLRYPLRSAVLAGLALFQIGEFAFILSATGLQYDLLDNSTYQYFLAISILSMAVTPLVMANDERIADWVFRRPLPERLLRFSQLSDHTAEEPEEALLKDHVIIIGYGLSGQNVARAAKFAKLPYVVLELDPVRVEQARRDGHPTSFGDGTSDFVLRHLHVYNARIAVIAVSHSEAARRIIPAIRAICQTVYIIVRTRAVSEVEDFFELGANEVVPEEFEVSIEIFTRMLNRYFVPQDEVETFTDKIREGSYEMLRAGQRASGGGVTALLSIPELNVTCLKAQHSENEIIGRTLAESHLRKRFGVSLIALMRNEEFVTDIRPDTKILQDDILYVVGKPGDVAKLNEELKY
jgi:monovalent cation:H+ antiporter-2, CPA2 family